MSLCLQAAGAVVDPQGVPYQEKPADLQCFRDLAERFEHPLDLDRLCTGPHVTHRHLTDLLAGQVREHTADLVVVAHALPDVLPYSVTASHAGLLFGDDVHGFSVSEQGLAAPFTALRIISAFQRVGRARQPLLLVLEQTTLPLPDPLADGEGYAETNGGKPLSDSGVLLAFGPAGRLRLGPAQNIATDIAAEELPGRLAALVEAVPGQAVVVLGPQAERLIPAPIGTRAHVHRTGPGSYATSVWLALATHWEEWQQRFAAVVLSDVDPRTGRGCLAVLGR